MRWAESQKAGSADIEIVVGGISRSLGRRNHTLLKLWSAESQEIVCDMNAWIFVVSPSAAHCRVFVVACSKGLHQSILAWTKTTRMKWNTKHMFSVVACLHACTLNSKHPPTWRTNYLCTSCITFLWRRKDDDAMMQTTYTKNKNFKYFEQCRFHVFLTLQVLIAH